MTERNSSLLVSVLRLDATSDERIRGIMRPIHRLMGRKTGADSPHISLVPTDFQDEMELLGRMRHLAASTPAFDIALSHLGWFAGGVIFLGATPTQPLLTLHQQLYDLSAASPITPWIDLYCPGRWVPHCTIAMQVPYSLRVDVIAAALREETLPVCATCTAIELVRMEEGRLRSVGVAELRGG